MLRSCETKWLKLGEYRRSSIKNQFTHSNIATSVDEKCSKNHGDLIRPGNAITRQSSKKVMIRHFH